MKLIYQNKTLNLINCTTFFPRLIGLMGQTNINHALIFPHCNSVHTFFMKQNIDIIMCDDNYNIVKYYPNTPKNKVILPQKHVTIVIETPPHYFPIKLNTQIKIED